MRCTLPAGRIPRCKLAHLDPPTSNLENVKVEVNFLVLKKMLPLALLAFSGANIFFYYQEKRYSIQKSWALKFRHNELREPLFFLAEKGRAKKRKKETPSRFKKVQNKLRPRRSEKFFNQLFPGLAHVTFWWRNRNL